MPYAVVEANESKMWSSTLVNSLPVLGKLSHLNWHDQIVVFTFSISALS